MVPELIFVEHIAAETAVSGSLPTGEGEGDLLSLPFERRQIARQRVTLETGQIAGLKLPRGTLLRQGDLVKSLDGTVARVQAAEETVSMVRCESAQELARAAYHLGNRHVWVQVGPSWLRYLHDHVLDEMLQGLGFHVQVQQAPFEPEAGAYSEIHSHSHG